MNRISEQMDVIAEHNRIVRQKCAHAEHAILELKKTINLLDNELENLNVACRKDEASSAKTLEVKLPRRACDSPDHIEDVIVSGTCTKCGRKSITTFQYD